MQSKMNGDAKSDSNSDEKNWSEVAKKLLGTFEKLALYIFKVEWLTPTGKMNFFAAIVISIIFIILAFRGTIQNDTLEILLAFFVLFIMSVALSSHSYEAATKNKLRKS